jgi:hypothetical protein
MRGPIFNQDCTEFFVANRPETMSGELIDTFVDSLAAAGVGALFSNTSGQRANYDSHVRQTYWDGYDPDGPDNQPCFDGYPAERLPVARPLLDGMLRLARMGIDFHARAIERCRVHGMEGWISVRMNDVHDVDICAGPQISAFWKENPQFRRVPYRFSTSFDRQLDYARPEVRAHYWSLLEEIVNRYNLDGLELDFMRFPHYFRVGHELDGGQIMTAWLRDVRDLTSAAALRLGHAVKLGVRVPAEPETARNMGLDGVRWAHEGLVDLLTVTPFWETSDFTMPIRLWKRLLEGTNAGLAVGLEILVRPYHNAVMAYQSPASSAGVATAALYEGADYVYLFNHFFDMAGQRTGQWAQAEAETYVRAMSSLNAVAALPRRHILTYRDTRAPGEPDNDSLPQTGTLAVFRLHTGPRPVGREVRVVLGFEALQDAPFLFKPPVVRVNGVLCAQTPEQVGGTTIAYTVPQHALADEAHTVEIDSDDGKPFTVVWVEMAVN